LRIILAIASRYVFSRKKRNVINFITAISIVGIALSTAAMVIVLSAFNGIEKVVEDMYGASDSDIKISPATGKWIQGDEALQIIENNDKLPGYITNVWPFIEETVILQYGEQWVLAKLKGVDNEYFAEKDLQEKILEGRPCLGDTLGMEMAVAGGSLLGKLGAMVYGSNSEGVPYTPIKIFGLAGSKKLSSSKENAVNEGYLYISADLRLNPVIDHEYIYTTLSFAGSILQASEKYSGIEIDLNSDADADEVKEILQQKLGKKYIVKTRPEQNELMYNTNRTEKRITFIILLFIFILSTFNLIAVLAMMILEKERDIKVLRSMGFSRNGIFGIFVTQGVLVCWIGAFAGILLGLTVCLLQMEFGMITMQGSIVEAYPVLLKVSDFINIFIMVFSLGVLLSALPVFSIVRARYQKRTI
jgi:lipoprotein-releasing system permease protein